MRDDLDRAIDVAARALMTRDPSRSLGHTVMARVRVAREPAPRRFMWAAAVATVVVCSAITIAMINSGRVRLQADRDLPIAQVPAAPRWLVGLPATLPQPPVTLIAEAPPVRRAIAMAPTRSTVTRTALPTGDDSPIELIHTDPIVMSSIEVPQLQRETTAIDALNVEPLTIEPLATSND